jgi:Pectate lyase superfamily protein
MPKSIPTSGTLNWSIPLNEHISQLQDPTNGAINSFSQFSQRPTNLTANDIGKTYLYTQTGNIHQWTGTTWKVLNESVVNVKDYGAFGDGVVDDITVIKSIITNNINSPRTLFFPRGTYKITDTISPKGPIVGSFGFNMIGEGRGITKLNDHQLKQVDLNNYSLLGCLPIGRLNCLLIASLLQF